MTSIASNPSIEECTDPACIHSTHEIDRDDPEDRAFHETAGIEGPTFRVWVTRFDNELAWSVEAEAQAALRAEDALAYADAIRLQAGVANALTEEIHNGQH